MAAERHCKDELTLKTHGNELQLCKSCKHRKKKICPYHLITG